MAVGCTCGNPPLVPKIRRADGTEIVAEYDPTDGTYVIDLTDDLAAESFFEATGGPGITVTDGGPNGHRPEIGMCVDPASPVPLEFVGVGTESCLRANIPPSLDTSLPSTGNHCQVLRGDGWENEDNASLSVFPGGGVVDHSGLLPPAPQANAFFSGIRFVSAVPYSNTHNCTQIVTFTAHVWTRVRHNSTDFGHVIYPILGVGVTGGPDCRKVVTHSNSEPGNDVFDYLLEDELSTSVSIPPGGVVQFTAWNELNLSIASLSEWDGGIRGYQLRVINHTDGEV